MPLAAGLVRGFNVDRLDKFPQRIGGKLVQTLVFAYGKYEASQPRSS